MASESANTCSDDEIAPVTDDAKIERHDLVEGRVWRRPNSVVSSKASGGPVLRTTVKPVKRFRPEASNEKATNPSPNRKKKLKLQQCNAVKYEDSSATGSGKKHTNSESGISISPDKRGSTLDTDKSQQQSGNSVDSTKKKGGRLWSSEDIDYFFEAVSLYGKDFDAITSSIAQKRRRKGHISLSKTALQVRHFYYRTWTMINKLINSDSYPLEINKAFQELYAIINYGEMRRRLGRTIDLKKKYLDKLNELIKHGTTSVRAKGKNFRIKTPSCRALKKLSPEYQKKEGMLDLPLVSDTRRVRVPHCLTIELHPLTVADWNLVHSYAHNPRLRLRVAVENPLSSVFLYLDRKWKPPSERMLFYADKAAWNAGDTGAQERYHMETPTLILQTPADAPVNTRFMVFRISSTNNKSQASVCYALRKASQRSNKPTRSADEKISDSAKEPDVVVCDTNEGAVSETEAIDSCLSSEEDYDYDSANDESNKASKSDFNEESLDRNISAEADEYSTQTLDTIFTIKTKGNLSTYGSESEDEDAHEQNEQADRQADDGLVFGQDNAIPEEVTELVDDITADICKDSNERQTSKITEPSANLIEEIVEAMDVSQSTTGKSVIDGCMGNGSEKCVVGEVPETRIQEIEEVGHDNTEAAKTPKSDAVKAAVEISEDPRNVTSDATNTDEDSRSKDDEKPAPHYNIDETGKKGDVEELKQKVSLSDPKYDSKKRTRKRFKTTDFMKSVQTWNMENSENTTIADIYMMLMRPSVIRLCYHWVCKTTESSSKPDKQTPQEVPTSQTPASLTSSLLALLQAADITSQVRDAASSKKEKASPVSQLRNVSVQCELLKQPVTTSDGATAPAASTASANPHGRGLRKSVSAAKLPATTSQPLPEFVVPTLPAISRRKTSEVGLRHTNLSPETMNALLQRERLRNRLIRRNTFVERSTLRPVRTITRPMKTFSIVTQGPNKVGFLPSEEVHTSNEEKVQQDSQSTIDGGGDHATTKLSENNLLAQAAHEAGVFLDSLTFPSSINSITPSSEESLTDIVQSAIESTTGGETLNDSELNLVDTAVTPDNHDQSSNKINCDNLNETITTSSLVPQNPPHCDTIGIENSSVSTTKNCNLASSDDNQIVSADVASRTDITVPTATDEFVRFITNESLDIQDADSIDYLPATPQKILPSDSEDSFDGLLIRQPRYSGVLQRPSAATPALVEAIPDAMRTMPQDIIKGPVSMSTDIALDLQLPTLIGEDSIDLVSKFQDLVQHTTEGTDLNTLANDDNARDRPLCDFLNSTGFDNG